MPYNKTTKNITDFIIKSFFKNYKITYSSILSRKTEVSPFKFLNYSICCGITKEQFNFKTQTFFGQEKFFIEIRRNEFSSDKYVILYLKTKLNSKDEIIKNNQIKKLLKKSIKIFYDYLKQNDEKDIILKKLLENNIITDENFFIESL